MYTAMRKIMPELEKEASEKGISVEKLSKLVQGLESSPEELPSGLKSKIRAISYLYSGLDSGRKHPFRA